MEARGAQEWAQIVCPTAAIMSAGPTCFAGRNAPFAIDFCVFSRNARFLVSELEAVLASLPAHRPVDFCVAVEDLAAKVWAAKAPKPANSERLFGPAFFDKESIAQLEVTVEI